MHDPLGQVSPLAHFTFLVLVDLVLLSVLELAQEFAMTFKKEMIWLYVCCVHTVLCNCFVWFQKTACGNILHLRAKFFQSHKNICIVFFKECMHAQAYCSFQWVHACTDIFFLNSSLWSSAHMIQEKQIHPSPLKRSAFKFHCKATALLLRKLPVLYRQARQAAGGWAEASLGTLGSSREIRQLWWSVRCLFLGLE